MKPDIKRLQTSGIQVQINKRQKIESHTKYDIDKEEKTF